MHTKEVMHVDRGRDNALQILVAGNHYFLREKRYPDRIIRYGLKDRLVILLNSCLITVGSSVIYQLINLDRKSVV